MFLFEEEQVVDSLVVNTVRANSVTTCIANSGRLDIIDVMKLRTWVRQLDFASSLYLYAVPPKNARPVVVYASSTQP